jgi:hypothetical protein
MPEMERKSGLTPKHSQSIRWPSLRNMPTSLEMRMGARVCREYLFWDFSSALVPQIHFTVQCIFSYYAIIWLIELYSFVLQCHTRPTLQLWLLGLPSNSQ